ncbi:MAG: type II secretion system protein [Sedimentisphaerales bacterium]|nr:type II secretion system protein [Sedimentisphaerales bacterium]
MARSGSGKNRGVKAFTLIELLVVVSIIALLVSILLPALNMARRQAKEVICATNLHSLFSFVNLYANDYNYWFPDLAVSPIDGEVLPEPEKYWPYWVQGDWRRYFLEEYDLQRKSLYSPCNTRWESDAFYFDNVNGNPVAQNTLYIQNRMVIGYMYFSSPTYGAQSDVYRMFFIDPPANQLPTRVFPRRLSDKGLYDFVFTDLNRQFPYNPGRHTWVTPGDEDQRWGSNHLYEADGWPKGSHVANRDGSVTWTIGDDLELRVRVTSYSSRPVGYYW